MLVSAKEVLAMPRQKNPGDVDSYPFRAVINGSYWGGGNPNTARKRIYEAFAQIQRFGDLVECTDINIEMV